MAAKTPTKPKPKGKFAWPSAPAKKVHSISWEAQKAKVKKAKLAAPIVPGSSITERQLAQAAEAATTTQFGDLDREQKINLAQAQSQQRDFGGAGGFYDQYLAQVAQHAANVNNIAAQANQAVGGIQQGVTGLAAADLTQLQGQANQLAAQRGMPGTPAGDVTQMASNAAAVRQSLAGSFAAQQAAQNAAAQTYAGAQANVVAPGQKLQGQASLARGVTKAREDIAATAAKKGAFTQQYKEEQRASESKNVLAQQVATGKTAAQLAQQAETTRHNKATESNDAARIDAETQKAADKAAADANKTILTGPFTGKSQSWLSSASDAEKQRLIDAYDKSKGKGSKGAGGKGPDWVTQGEMGTGLSQATALKGLAKLAKEGKPFKQYTAEELKKWKKVPKDRAGAEAKINATLGPKIKNPFLLRAALDAVYDGHLSAYTVKHLISSGYKPSEVASALGTTTHGQWLKTPAGKAWLRQQRGPGKAQTKANTKAYGEGSGPTPMGHK